MKNLIISVAVLLSGASMATADVTFYTDQDVFEGLYPGLATEDYSNTLVPPDSVQTTPDPFNIFTDNECFYPGAIVDGLSFNNRNDGDNAVLTPPFLGVTSVVVGPNTFDHSSDYSFWVPVNAFGVDIVMVMGDDSVDIEVFGATGSLDTTFSAGNLAGVFWGVYSDEEITKITFYGPPYNGELFTNVQFGQCVGLDNSTWGAIKTSF